MGAILDVRRPVARAQVGPVGTETRQQLRSSMMDWSIVIPCGDDSVGLLRTLRSIVSSMPAGACCEVIVVNDGAHPKVSDVVAEYAPVVREVRLESNAGSYAARNAGICISSGACIAFIDAGCWLREDWFSKIDDAIADNDYVAGNIVTDADLCDNLGKMYSCLVEFNSRLFFRVKRFGATANLLIRRSLIHKVGMFDEALRSGGDFEFGTRLDAFPDIRKHFQEDLVVFHEPRSLKEMIVKEHRLIRGNLALRARYGQRFNYWEKENSAKLAASFLRRGWMVVKPPALRGYTRPLTAFGVSYALQLYFLIWGMKFYNFYLRRKLSRGGARHMV